MLQKDRIQVRNLLEDVADGLLLQKLCERLFPHALQVDGHPRFGRAEALANEVGIRERLRAVLALVDHLIKEHNAPAPNVGASTTGRLGLSSAGKAKSFVRKESSSNRKTSVTIRETSDGSNDMKDLHQNQERNDKIFWSVDCMLAILDCNEKMIVNWKYIRSNLNSNKIILFLQLRSNPNEGRIGRVAPADNNCSSLKKFFALAQVTSC